MRSCFRFVIAFIVFSWGWLAFGVCAQEDLVAKAQKERELVVYGTAFAAPRRSPTVYELSRRRRRPESSYRHGQTARAAEVSTGVSARGQTLSRGLGIVGYL